MKSIGDLSAEYEKKVSRAPRGRGAKTERGELMRFFCRHLNHARKQDGLRDISMARMGFILEQIPTSDLYYLQSVCTKAKNFSKRFWWEIDPKKHIAENPF
jgi:hypothetical protein